MGVGVGVGVEVASCLSRSCGVGVTVVGGVEVVSGSSSGNKGGWGVRNGLGCVCGRQ